jgi:molybdenum cofactor cytidylyltransferase
MPLVPPATIDKILAAFDPEEGRDIVVPIHDGQRGNPVLWSSKYFPELLGLTGDTGARNILLTHMETVAEVAASDAVLRDFDTQDALIEIGAKI